MVYEIPDGRIVGAHSSLVVPDDDEITPRLLMLIEASSPHPGTV
jgi:hypothetical protein